MEKTLAISTLYDEIGSPFGEGGSHDTVIPPVRLSIAVESESTYEGTDAALIVLTVE